MRVLSVNVPGPGEYQPSPVPQIPKRASSPVGCPPVRTSCLQGMGGLQPCSPPPPRQDSWRGGGIITAGTGFAPCPSLHQPYWGTLGAAARGGGHAAHPAMLHGLDTALAAPRAPNTHPGSVPALCLAQKWWGGRGPDGAEGRLHGEPQLLHRGIKHFSIQGQYLFRLGVLLSTASPSLLPALLL